MQISHNGILQEKLVLTEAQTWIKACLKHTHWDFLYVDLLIAALVAVPGLTEPRNSLLRQRSCLGLFKCFPSMSMISYHQSPARAAPLKFNATVRP